MVVKGEGGSPFWDQQCRDKADNVHDVANNEAEVQEWHPARGVVSCQRGGQ